MKKLLFTFLISFTIVSYGQAPQEISYQGVARNVSGSLLSNQNIGIKLDLHMGSSGGAVVFSESHNKTTNAFGLFTLEIGSVNNAAFTAINWANGPYFLEVSMDPAGGSAYTSVGTQQFMSVPYALYAQTSGNAAPTPTISINAPNTITAVGGGYTINIPAAATYSAGAGINVAGNIISNTAPDQTVTITPAGSASVTGTYPNFTINTPTSQTYSAGNGISIAGGVISNTAAAVTPTIVGTGATTVNGVYPNLTINTPTIQAYSAGNGIDITGGVITNTAAGAVTPTIVGTGATTVNGTYPNLTINTPTVAPDQIVTIAGTNAATITGAYPNFTVNVPSGTSLPTGFNGQFLFNTGTVWDTLPRQNLYFDGTNFGVGTTAPQATFHVVGAGKFDASVSTNQIYTANFKMNGTNSGYVLTSDASGNGTWQAIPSPTLSYNNGTNVLSLSQGTTVTTATLVGTGSSTVSVVGAGLATVTPTTGSTFTVSVPNPTLSIASGSISISNGNSVAIPSPSLTINSNSLTINGPGGNTVLLPAGTTYTNGSGISITSGSVITNTSPNQTVTLNGTGATSVTGSYPNFTITSPTTSSTPPTIVGTGATSVTSSGNTFTVNTPASQTYTNGAGISVTSGSIITNAAPDQTVSLVGTGATNVSGTYPNFTINTPTVASAITQTLTGTGISSVTTGANTFTVNTPMPTYVTATGVLNFGGTNTVVATPSLSIAGNVIRSGPASNTITLPTSSTTTLTQGSNITVSGPVSDYTVSAPAYSLTSNSNTLTLNNGTSITTATVPAVTLPLLSYTAFAANGKLQSGPVTNTVSIPNYTLSNTSNTINLSNGVASSSAIVLAPTLSLTGTTLISGPASNSVTLPVSVITGTGTGIATVTTSVNNFTVNVPTPTFTGVGTTSVTGTYPSYTISTPTVAAGWTTTGNTGTVDGTNFIGTTDNIALNFRVNNQKAGKISSLMGDSSTFFGYQSGNISTGAVNTAFGHQALLNNTTGAGNNALGYQTLKSNISGNDNSAIGHKALFSNTTGYQNIAIGNSALLANTTGYGNTSVGRVSNYYNTTGFQNTALGHAALFNNTTGSYNTAVGKNALYSNVAGLHGTAVGYNALYYANNTATTFTNYNVAVGFEALRGSATPASNTGNENTAIGFQTLFNNTAGNFNTAVGQSALFNNTTGNNNTALGRKTLYSNTTGYENLAIGYGALNFNTTGIRNSAVGSNALINNTTGTGNTGTGQSALGDNTTGGSNTANGYTALRTNITGFNNTGIGAEAGFSNTAGSGNVFLGFQAGYNETGSNKLYIANSNAGQPLIYGDFSTGNVGIGATVALADKLRIDHASSSANAHLHLKQTGGDAFSRIKFSNSVASTKHWINSVTSDASDANSGYNVYYFNGSVGHNIFTVAGDGLVSVNTFSTMNNARFYVGGKVKIDSTLTMAAYNLPPTQSPGNEGRIYFDRTAQKFKVSENGGAYVDMIGGGGSSPWTQGSGVITQNNPGDLVGIGTAAPTSALHVYGTADPLQIMVQNTGGGFKTGYAIKTATEEWFMGQDGNPSTGFRITDRDAMEVRFQIDQIGRIGMGTMFASERLDVAGNIKLDSSLMVTGLASVPPTSNGGNGRIYFDQSSNKFKVSENGGAYVDMIGGGGSSPWTQGSGIITQNNITDKVGIGTNTPAYSLDVNGDGQFTDGISSGGQIDIGNSGNYQTFKAAENGGLGAGINLQATGGGRGYTIYSANSSGSLEFLDETAGLTRMVINPSGNVGINTTSPSAKLHSVNTANTGSAGRFENNSSTNTADAVFVLNSSTGAAVHAVSAATSSVAVWLENGHLRSTQAAVPATSTISVSGGGITGVLVSIPAGGTDVKGVLNAVLTTTTMINSGNNAVIRVTFSKAYSTAPVVVLTSLIDPGALNFFISAVSPSSFNVTIKNSTPGNMTTPASFPVNLNYMVIE
ncbi:MAG: hypothetical protein V4565_09350 [Bacteroidota bacterium]